MPLANLLDKLTDKLTGWVELFVVMLPNLLLAMLAVVLAFPLSRWARGLSSGVITRITRNPPISKLAATLVRVLVMLLGISFALELLKLDKTVTSLIAGLGVAGLALGFAFQDIASNFMAGFMMAMTRPFDVGDLVEVGGHNGRIVNMAMRDTEIETVDGRSVLIPNREVFQNPIVNFTRTPSRRLELTISTAYSEDMEMVRGTIIEALAKLEGRLADEEVEVLFFEFADSAVKAQVLVWLAEADELPYRRSRSAALILIKRAFDEKGIVIPVPIRTLDVGPELAARQ